MENNTKHTYGKLNLDRITKKQTKFNKQILRSVRKEKAKKIFYYALGVCFPVFLVYYVMKANGMFKKLQLDKRYKERTKTIEQRYNIDMDTNNKLINEFEEKWDINYSEKELEKRLKYGNKDLNAKEEGKDIDIATSQVAGGNNLTSLKDSSSTSSLDEIVEKYNQSDKSMEIIKGKDYEQFKIYTGSERNNDPKNMGNVVIFDTRLNTNKKA